MKKISIIRFSFLRNEAHYQFFVVYSDLLTEAELIEILPPELWTKFTVLLAKEKGLLDIDRSNSLTRQLAEADAREDRDLVGIHSAIVSGMHHYDPETAKAARELNERYRDFGRIRDKPYEEQVAAVTIFLDDLSGKYAPHVEKLNLQGWVADLREANSEFQRIFVARNAQIAARPAERFSTIKVEIEDTYRLLNERIEASAVLSPTPTIETFISNINSQIAYFNEHSRRPVKYDIAQAVFESIPEQIISGNKVATPIPVVSFNGVLLVFADDYTVSYRDNRKPGTATVIVKGKGKYTGRRELSFNIVAAPLE